MRDLRKADRIDLTNFDGWILCEKVDWFGELKGIKMS